MEEVASGLPPPDRDEDAGYQFFIRIMYCVLGINVFKRGLKVMIVFMMMLHHWSGGA